jgi:hypothetical protein
MDDEKLADLIIAVYVTVCVVLLSICVGAMIVVIK